MMNSSIGYSLVGTFLLLFVSSTNGFTATSSNIHGRRYRDKIPVQRQPSLSLPSCCPTEVSAITPPLFAPPSCPDRPYNSNSNNNNNNSGLVNNRHSASDWFYNVRTFLQSEILREIKGPVLAVAGWSAVVSMVHRILITSTNHKLAAMGKHMCVPGTAHSFLVSALSLLLVFRTNSAYQRFYEGRKIWEHILSVSRNLSRIVHLYGNEIGSKRQRRILNLAAAFPYLLRHHIRPGCLCSKGEVDTEHRLRLWEPSRLAVETRHEGDDTTYDGDVVSSNQEVLSSSSASETRECFVDKRALPWSLFESQSLPKIAVAPNRPLWACDRMGRELMSIPYGPNFTSRERLTLLGQVEKLTNAVGQCERIHQTAVPLNYARHSLRSLTLWLFTLPFCIIKDMGLLTAPVTACVAWALFGVYQIGYSIEDPFAGSLRLSVLCDAIRRDVIGDTVMSDDIASQQQVDSQYDLEDIWEDGSSSKKKKRDSEPSEVMPLKLLDEEVFLNSAPQLIQENNGAWNVVGVVEG